MLNEKNPFPNNYFFTFNYTYFLLYFVHHLLLSFSRPLTLLMLTNKLRFTFTLH